MKEFMFFIRKQRNSKEALAPPVHEQFLRACETYINDLKKQGKLLSAQPIDWSGTILATRSGQWTDEPFNQVEEVISGYYHILARDQEQAEEIARANPEFRFNPGTRIEVRPVKMKEETGFVYPSMQEGRE